MFAFASSLSENDLWSQNLILPLIYLFQFGR